MEICAVFTWQRRQARRRGVADPRTGGAINLNVHFHTLIPDGVFDVEGDGPARFAVAGRILLHLGLDSRGPPVARAQAPPDFSELGPSHDGADPAYADRKLPALVGEARPCPGSGRLPPSVAGGPVQILSDQANQFP